MDKKQCEKIVIMDIPVCNVTMREAIGQIQQFTKGDKVHLVFTPNPEIIMTARENERLSSILNKADLVVPDGIGVVIASKFLRGNTLKERVAGYDMVQNTMKEAVSNGYKYYFLGSKPGIANKAAEEMRKLYPGIQIVGTHDGYFKPEESERIIEAINASGANILLVALGAPKQEIWIEENKDKLTHIRVAIGVGGSLDVMAGVVKRAPFIYQKLGLEWFYRLVKEPSRFGRMLVLPKFLLYVLLRK
ncbi:glycosyltransferase [Sporanaerobium hydrogeniformans]|uniref:Glycosyltransferase n=1 Tax=Sporanaerobium hydrogeniformans TaxID=3072179 RepID=A0AC61DDJ2_9FIRM|nr:WecB/TagA/CpsF family glycosyltransferase [Sporanaerobium hydrogeniformans]PHV71266.1 glycosyltransferase [Sporanaerobium hydrogeniformans]